MSLTMGFGALDFMCSRERAAGSLEAVPAQRGSTPGPSSEWLHLRGVCQAEAANAKVGMVPSGRVATNGYSGYGLDWGWQRRHVQKPR